MSNVHVGRFALPTHRAPMEEPPNIFLVSSKSVCSTDGVHLDTYPRVPAWPELYLHIFPDIADIVSTFQARA